jgi:hypothetical protein
MTLRMSSRRKKSRWLGLAIALCTLSALAIATTLAHSGINSIPSNFFTVTDQQGVNDVNSDQVDLTQFGRDDSSAGKYKLFWSWDSINSWTGTGQTGDACALFDTTAPGDGKIDYAVCARVANLNADPNNVQIVPQDATHPVFLFSCSNAKNDRCAQPTGPLSYTQGTDADGGVIGTLAKANLITDTDPFPAGQSNPHDTTIEVDVSKTKIPGNEVLVNVCSYPSAGNGGNNNPFDCIVTPGGGFLQIIKDAAGDTSTSFAFTVAPAPVAPQPSTYNVKEGTPSPNIGIAITSAGSVTETVPTDWNNTDASCVKSDGTTSTGTFDSTNHKVTGIAIESGKLTTCTFKNRLKNGTLIVKKVVTNDNGGSKHATDFSFSVNGGASTAFLQDGSDVDAGKNTLSLAAGTAFSVTEVGTPIAGYTTSYSGCTGTIAANTTSTCTITNNDQAATLIVKKIVTNDSGGTKHATDFSFSVNGGASTAFLQDGSDVDAGKNTLSVNAGTYNVVETGTPISGYDTSYSGCASISLANGATATCTITNNDQAATLIVKKVVINDNGGTKHATDFSFALNGGASTAFLQDGSDVDAGKNTLSVSAGSFSVVESGLPISGYSTSSSGCSGTIANGETKTCTITNNDQAATLIVIKHVVNNNGGSKVAADFTMSVTGTNVSSSSFAGAESPGTTVTLDAGSYSVDEGAHVGYDKSLSADCSGTIAVGQSKTCTITNNDQAATLVVIKHVINDNGGSKVAGNFTMSVTGTNVSSSSFAGAESPGTTVTLDAGLYSVDEGAHDGYDKSLSADCSGTIALGATKTCTITNDDHKFDPTGGTTMGWKINDAASFGIRAGASNAASATITFKLYKDPDGVLDINTCTTANQVGSASTVGVTLTNSGATAGAASVDFTVGIGTYFWVATYNGDQFNNTASTACGSEVTTIQ